MKTFLKTIVSIVIAALILASIAAGLYWFNWNKNAPAALIDIKLEKDNLKVGEPTGVELSIQTPWYRSVDNPIELSTDSVAALSHNVSITKSGFNLSGYTWKVKTNLIPFEKGEHKDLAINVGLSPDREKKQKNLTVSLPEIKVSAAGFTKTSDVALKDELNAADLLKVNTAENASSNVWLWPAIGAFIALIIAVIILRSKKTQQRILSPWEIARNALSELKKELSVKDEVFFVRLSDILRQYIEKRFALPATEKTSEEFIQQLRNDSILSEKQRIALERFLGTADLVKFARMNSDEKQKNECLAMADSFVDETIPRTVEAQQ
ncbi:MAG: hypothetical protein NE327_01765 [Lentisphaeraceae bacterium]|nr:hypothetical protein [Lentisphaeraceae bacterium]